MLYFVRLTALELEEDGCGIGRLSMELLAVRCSSPARSRASSALVFPALSSPAIRTRTSLERESAAPCGGSIAPESACIAGAGGQAQFYHDRGLSFVEKPFSYRV